jgi:hypothetical protein
MDDVENWVTIASLNWLPEAEVLKTFLQSQGIEAFIPEEHISTINPIMTGVQVRVQVRTSSVEEAKVLLQKFQPDLRKPKCPSCGGEDIRVKPIGVKGWAQFLVCALMAVPMKGSSKKVCGSCGVNIPL